ncbi:hypothetical protein CF328_g8948, partial [Tilletia controversa]
FPELALNTLADAAIFDSQRTEHSPSPTARKRQRIDRATSTSAAVLQQQVVTGLPPQQPSSASLAGSNSQQLPPDDQIQQQDPRFTSAQVQHSPTQDAQQPSHPQETSSHSQQQLPQPSSHPNRVHPARSLPGPIPCYVVPGTPSSYDSPSPQGSNLLQAVGENSVTSSSLAALVSCTEAVEGAIPAASEQATTNGLRRPPTLSGPVLREEGSAHDAPPHGPSFKNKADPLKALPRPISAKGMVSPSAQGVNSTDQHQVFSDQPPQSPLVLPTVASAPPTEVVVENEDAPSTSVPSALVPSAKPQVTPCYSPLPDEIFGPPAHVSSNAPYTSFPSSQPQVPTHAPLADAVVVQLS